MNLTVMPDLGNPQVLLAPDEVEAFDKLKSYLVDRAAYEIGAKMAKAEGVEYSVFVKELDLPQNNGKKDEIYDRALNEALPLAFKLKGLVERVTVSIALDAKTRKVHEKLGETSFIDYVSEKFGNVSPESKTMEEIVYFLEVIEFYQSSSRQKNYSHDLFATPLTYGKMVAAISTLKQKTSAVAAAKRLLEDQEYEIDKRATSLRRAKSDAMLRGEELEPYDEALESVKEEKKHLQETHAEPIFNLEVNAVAYIEAAVDLSNSPVAREMIAVSLPNVAEMKLKQRGLDPTKIAIEHKRVKEASKPVAHTYHTEREVYVSFAVPKRFYKIVRTLLEGTFDVRLSTLEDAKTLLESFRNPRKEG
jgi:hypothetical protein